MSVQYIAYRCRRFSEDKPYRFVIEVCERPNSKPKSFLKGDSIEGLISEWRVVPFNEMPGGDVLITIPGARTYGECQDVEEPLTSDELVQLRLLRIVENASHDRHIDWAKTILKDRYGR